MSFFLSTLLSFFLSFSFASAYVFACMCVCVSFCSVPLSIYVCLFLVLHFYIVWLLCNDYPHRCANMLYCSSTRQYNAKSVWVPFALSLFLLLLLFYGWCLSKSVHRKRKHVQTRNSSIIFCFLCFIFFDGFCYFVFVEKVCLFIYYWINKKSFFSLKKLVDLAFKYWLRNDLVDILIWKSSLRIFIKFLWLTKRIKWYYTSK